MTRRTLLPIALLVAGLGIGFFASNRARSDVFAPPPPPLGPFEIEIAKTTKVAQEDVDKVLTEFGAQLSRQLAAGREIELPGCGSFRVARLPESRNLEDGRPVIQPATNVVVFLPDESLTQAANAPGAVPATVVPAFQYVPLPGQTPSTKTPYNRAPSTRVR